MISLAQYNLAHSANGIGAPCRNGIACPRCSAEAHIAALPADDPMRDGWQFAPYFSRAAVGIEAARVALGLTNEQVDALFAAAGQVVA